MHLQQFYLTPLGILKITEEDGFITEISIEKNNITVNEQKSSPLLEKACVQLGEYFAGKRKSFDLPIKMHGTIFQKQVFLYHDRACAALHDRPDDFLFDGTDVCVPRRGMHAADAHAEGVQLRDGGSGRICGVLLQVRRAG